MSDIENTHHEKKEVQKDILHEVKLENKNEYIKKFYIAISILVFSMLILYPLSYMSMIIVSELYLR